MLLLLSCAINDTHTLVQPGAEAPPARTSPDLDATSPEPRTVTGIEAIPGAVVIDGLTVDAVSWGRSGRHTALPQAAGGIGAAGGAPGRS